MSVRKLDDRVEGCATLKRIGVLTSGGDAPGMNACIRAVVRGALGMDMEVIGIRRGYAGLIDGDSVWLSARDVGDVIHRGGTILGTARSEAFRTPSGQAEALRQARALHLDGLVVIGGDGSFRGAMALGAAGLPCVGVPGTIDNDLSGTDFTIGFDTAVNTALDAINRIRDTATSHGRTFVVEVMGRNTGWIALMAGLCGGAESILIPELPLTMEMVCERLQAGITRGKRHSIIVVAEGVGSGFTVAKEIDRCLNLETRVTVLGHIQRGGSPTAVDRALASRLGMRAVEALARGEFGVMAGQVGAQVKVTPLAEVVDTPKPPPQDLMALVERLAI